MRVVEIRHKAGLEQLRSAWDRLAGESASKTIFLTWEWVATWWSVYGNRDDLRILTVLDEHGVLRGIAPLRCQNLKKYGQTVPALSFVGDGSMDSEYLDFIIAPGYEMQVLEAFYNHYEQESDGGAVLLLNEIPETSPNLAPLRALAAARAMDLTESDIPCATVRLPSGWDDYLRMLQPRFRTKIRSVLRNLEGRPEVAFRFCNDVRQLEQILPILFDLHTRRWAQDGKPGVFGWDKKRDFYFSLSRLLLERRWLRLSWLEWKGQVLACQYGFAYGGTYSHLQEGYEPASEHWNLGVALRAWSIREFLKEGLQEYDFLGGVNRHKTDWGAQTKNSKRLLLTGRSYKNVLFRRGPAWEAATRESLRKILPEKLLELRHTALREQNGNSGDWMRQAAAKCYFHSGLPALTRPLRDRYQLSITANGKGSKVSWSRRAECSARILYYHRVNDENDPFFEAIPTRLFEEQVRYLTRHYKVLSMPEIMRHLEDGDQPETVVGITFDDGYQDNYHNAFPILKRYGAPATVFLNTGSLDSGEPLWFEHLAEAIKQTSRDYIDVEIDVPRRFWMRTLAERLESNRTIFAVLRVLDDAGRTHWLAEIHRQLGAVKDSERKNKMLSWDQVRLMKANAIDFGGHTVTHPFLSKLPPSQVSWEISECKRRIEEELQHPTDYFAYPNGREEDFAQSNKDILRAAGYRAAVTTIWGMNYRSTDPMELRRGGPWEDSAALFASKLDWYQLVNQ